MVPSTNPASFWLNKGNHAYIVGCGIFFEIVMITDSEISTVRARALKKLLSCQDYFTGDASYEFLG